ncbi:ATP-dependent Clp endopeptidase proteolytic subunit ClpP [Nicoletella semolina]|uniref:ATP-dependent Clp protease proteolytic subunit n=1 Tax=Nicoletella semolina TaxID=271160 RepID=A0A4R2N9E3_9PAST|nr:ClpP-like prohead protease/major capsid protein fusion protein [Nicoletella semolina]MDH2923794.1 peptidase S14 [Nicoletella semolina]TCP17631.1 ATP-dependent Clp endopeptidase proteolytic subunit ClpP [Nicoletella semolina]
MNWYKIQAKGKNSAEIAIYDEIGGWGISAQQFANDLKKLGEIKQIALHIHSPGGSVFDGIAMFNLLKNHPATKTVYIDGLAASMASVIAMVGDKVVMPENAMMMIHKPWGIQGGDAQEMRKYADLLDKLEATLIPAYAAKTGKSHEELAEMLAAETWFSGVEAVEHGFADELAKPVKAMAHIQSKRLGDYQNMPQVLKTMLFTPQGNANHPPAAEVPQAADQRTVPAVENTQNIAANPMTELAQRNATIKATFAAFGGQYDSLLVDCLADLSLSAEQAKDRLLAKLGEGTSPSVPKHHIYAGNGNLVGDSLKAALLERAGGERAEKGNPYTGMSLREMARASLVDRGVGVAGHNAMQVVGMAFTHSTSDFGNILLDVSHKSLMKGWEEASENFEQFTTKGILTDFRPAHRVGLGEFEGLDLIPEGSEYTYGTLSDTKAQVVLATYGKAFSITRQAIINDDMNLLTKIPHKMGRAARATIANLVFALLTGNHKTADGKLLFSNDHKNLIESGKLDLATIDKAIGLMNGQKSFDGRTQLAIDPDYLLTPTALHTRAKQILGSSSVEGADINTGIINPLQNIVPILKSHRLQAVSATDYYLINKEAIEVSYLDGIETPFIDQVQGFDIDGVKTKVRIDAGVNLIDYRGLVKVKTA